MRTIEEVIAELRNDIHSDVYLGKKTINTYLDEILEIHKAERPQGEQGEWIEHWDKGYVECPFCHKRITGGDLNFCVKCGADMRGTL